MTKIILMKSTLEALQQAEFAGDKEAIDMLKSLSETLEIAEDNNKYYVLIDKKSDHGKN